MDGSKDGFDLVGDFIGDDIFDGMEKLFRSFGLFSHTEDSGLEAIAEFGKHVFGVLFNP
jgi:hypothetical protein